MTQSTTPPHATTDDAIPPGFTRHFRASPMTDPWEPIYSKKTPQAVIIGLRLARPHTNSRGLVHGGLITTLADNAMGLSCAAQMSEPQRLLTVNLGIDFLGSANIGQWLAVETGFVKLGGSLCFAQCLVTADGVPCARANGTFKVIRAKPDQAVQTTSH
jgi:uncharacterized protein (TIGR00369 family)